MGLVALLRFPRVARVPLAQDRKEIVRFVLQSSLGTGIVSVRAWIAQILLGVVSTVDQVGLFRAAQAPQQGLRALSSPVRLILLTEQTRQWERGRPEAVLAGVRRYMRGAAALMVVAVPVFWLLMPWLFDLLLPDYGDAVDAARIVLLAGRDPARLRVEQVAPDLDRPPEPPRRRARDRDGRAHPAARRARPRVGRDRRGVRGARLDGRVRGGVDGAARAHPRASARAGVRGVKVLVVSGIWPPDVGGPASHAPEVAEWLARARARGRGA